MLRYVSTRQDAKGEPLEQLHDTPPCQFDRGSGTVLADHLIELRTPLAQISDGDFVLSNSHSVHVQLCLRHHEPELPMHYKCDQ